jgi:DNA-binding Xre family transcriptional regulator
MGDLLGVTESNYRRLESNKLLSINIKHLEKLLNFFDCYPNDIFEVILPRPSSSIDNLGHRIRLRVRELRLNHPNKPSQRFMGDLLGVTESNYRRLESNKLLSINIKHLEKLLEFFDCYPNEIFELEES